MKDLFISRLLQTYEDQAACPYEGFEEDMQMASDVYKSLHGIRTRWMYAYWRTLTEPDMRGVLDWLQREVEEELAREAREES